MANEIINGTDIFVFMDSVVVAHATSHTLSVKMATRNTSNKDSGIYETKAAGRMDVTASCDGLVVYEAGYAQLINAMALRLPVTLEFGQKATGTDTLDEAVWYASGEFLITSFDMNAPDAGNTTYSASFEHYSGFTFTASEVITVRGAYSEPALHDGVTGTAAVWASGGVAPYTYLWTFGAGGQVTVATAQCAYGMKGTAEGILYTCTVTDSDSNTGTYSFTMHSPVA
jgi:hypothetical protein